MVVVTTSNNSSSQYCPPNAEIASRLEVMYKIMQNERGETKLGLYILRILCIKLHMGYANTLHYKYQELLYFNFNNI